MTTALHKLLADYSPRLARDFSQVERWQAEGCDLDLDIIPVIEALMARKKDIYSLGFFTRHVREARDARIKRGILTPRQRAERIVIRRRYGGLYPTDERWLKQYEAVHGAVITG